MSTQARRDCKVAAIKMLQFNVNNSETDSMTSFCTGIQHSKDSESGSGI